jgi:chitinase
VLLSLGGWTDSAGDKYSRLVGDGSARRRFVIGVVSFLRRHHFRGLHFDWNYPVCWQSNCKKGASSDKPNFTKLIQVGLVDLHRRQLFYSVNLGVAARV